jgi:MinD superfamily P-loop ATPase
MSEELSGYWYVSDTAYGPMVHARLEPGEENSGRLVAVVRKRARELAEQRGARFLVTDGPPGIGCPVISTVSGADLAVAVTEPTLSGLHDLGRVLDVCRHFRVPAVVCINRYDLHLAGAHGIERECQSRGIPLAGHIPYDPAFTEAIVLGKPLVEFADGGASEAVRKVWHEVTQRLEAGE